MGRTKKDIILDNAVLQTLKIGDRVVYKGKIDSKYYGRAGIVKNFINYTGTYNNGSNTYKDYVSVRVKIKSKNKTINASPRNLVKIRNK